MEKPLFAMVHHSGPLCRGSPRRTMDDPRICHGPAAGAAMDRRNARQGSSKVCRSAERTRLVPGFSEKAKREAIRLFEPPQGVVFQRHVVGPPSLTDNAVSHRDLIKLCDPSLGSKWEKFGCFWLRVRRWVEDFGVWMMARNPHMSLTSCLLPDHTSLSCSSIAHTPDS